MLEVAILKFLEDDGVTAGVSFAVPCNKIVPVKLMKWNAQGFCTVGDFLCSSCIVNICEKERPTIF